MNEALQYDWVETRGISVAKIALNPITLNDEDMQKIRQYEEAGNMGNNAALALGRDAASMANAREIAAGNAAGAMTGFMGMGMLGNMGGGFNSAQQIAAMQQQQMAQQQMQPVTPAAGGWTCA